MTAKFWVWVWMLIVTAAFLIVILSCQSVQYPDSGGYPTRSWKEFCETKYPGCESKGVWFDPWGEEHCLCQDD